MRWPRVYLFIGLAGLTRAQLDRGPFIDDAALALPLKSDPVLETSLFDLSDEEAVVQLTKTENEEKPVDKDGEDKSSKPSFLTSFSRPINPWMMSLRSVLAEAVASSNKAKEGKTHFEMEN